MKIAGGGVAKVRKPSAKKNAGAGRNPNYTVSRPKPSPASGAKPASSRPKPKPAKKALGLPIARVTKKTTRKADNKYLIKASGTTKKEVQGVRAAVKSGRFTKKQGVKALNESGSRKRVKRALSR